MWRHHATRTAILACAFLLVGCGKEATGQVVAVVNGEEITLQEVNAELAGAQLPDGVDEKQVRQAALQRIIERRLLAQAAREEGLDKNPEFLIRSRQLEDALLVQLLTQKTGRTTKVPDASQVDAYVSDNAGVFAGRTIYAVDRIQFPMPTDPNRLKELEEDHTMEAVASKLKEMGIEFTRGAAQMDSAALPQAQLSQIRSLPEGEPFIIPQGGVVSVAVITGATPNPVDAERARPEAAQMMRNESLVDTLRKRLEAEKAEAEIEYQSGFAPPAPAKAENNAAGAEAR